MNSQQTLYAWSCVPRAVAAPSSPLPQHQLQPGQAGRGQRALEVFPAAPRDIPTHQGPHLCPAGPTAGLSCVHWCRSAGGAGKPGFPQRRSRQPHAGIIHGVCAAGLLRLYTQHPALQTVGPAPGRANSLPHLILRTLTLEPEWKQHLNSSD